MLLYIDRYMRTKIYTPRTVIL